MVSLPYLDFDHLIGRCCIHSSYGNDVWCHSLSWSGAWCPLLFYKRTNSSIHLGYSSDAVLGRGVGGTSSQMPGCQSSLQMPGIWEEGGVCQCLFVSSPDLSFPTYSISLISSKSFDIWPILWMWTFLYGLSHLSHTKQQSWHVWPCCTIHIACNVIQARPFPLPFFINSLLCSNSA